MWLVLSPLASTASLPFDGDLPFDRKRLLLGRAFVFSPTSAAWQSTRTVVEPLSVTFT